MEFVYIPALQAKSVSPVYLSVHQYILSTLLFTPQQWGFFFVAPGLSVDVSLFFAK